MPVARRAIKKKLVNLPVLAISVSVQGRRVGMGRSVKI